jgi:hypothetical protein
METIRMVAISGRGNSLFASRMGNVFDQGSPFLGQGEDLYARAKAAVAQWDSLVDRLRHIANKQVRDDLANTYGINEPGNKDKGQYMRDATASDVATAESYTPINYRVFVGPGPAKNRPGKLEDFDSSLRHDVEDAERTYGSLPDPQVITKTVTQTISSLPGWVLPVGAGVIGLGLLGAFGVIKI